MTYEELKTWICRDCIHHKQGRCQKKKYQDENGQVLGVRTSWNHRCTSGDFVRRTELKGENK